MNRDCSEPVIGDWHGNHAEIHAIVDHRLQHLGIVSAFNVDRHIRILLLEVGKHLGKDVQAGALVRSDDNFAAGHALCLSNCSHRCLAGVEGVFRKAQK